MNTGKLEVQWSPHEPDRFITFGTDLSLYQVEDIKDDYQQSLTQKFSETQFVSLLHTNSSHQYLKCVAWHPKPEMKYLLAVGLTNGKIALTSFGNDSDLNGLIGKEFVPRHPRQCNTLSWNPEESNLLAVGLDKVKTDHSILIWDIMMKSGKISDLDRRSITLNSDYNQISVKPIFELGHSEIAHSLQWFSHQPKTLIVGMSNKHLKIFDLRDANKHHNVTPTKAVYGIHVDPLSEHRVASFSETQVVVWDVRNFEKPVLSLNESKPITKLAWCPTRSNLLAGIYKDSHVIKLYDIQQISISTDEIEPVIFERVAQPSKQNLISSFAWHPTHENRLLYATPAGYLSDFTVFERITLNWSAADSMTWNCGWKTLQYLDNKKYFEALGDISIHMKQRALAGYGLKNPLSENGRIPPIDDKIESLWSWIDMVKTSQEEGAFKSWNRIYKFQGVRDIICSARIPNGGTTNVKSELLSKPWVGMISPRGSITAKMYVSDDRDKALQLCGWGFDKDGITLSKLLDKYEADGMYERAAAISVFNLKIRRGIESLKKGALTHQTPQGYDINLNVVAMALSGYTEDKAALWREMCHTLRPQLRHPYLRALFAFLTCDDDSYGEVLNETGVFVQDRVAFACMFLPDNKLADFLNKLTMKMIDTGNLEGILLTGVTPEGLDLLQQYLDMTGDVQTPCMTVLHALSNGFEIDGRIKNWVESYRNLLDQWRLWHQRAEFDVHWNRMNKASQPPQNVFISCNFCGKSISSYMGLQTPGGPKTRATMYGNKTKMTSCPGCRKPLPRCVLCLINMGTATRSGLIKQSEESEYNEHKVSQFSSWFTWCQTCRHGGHASHILEWFKDHTECPVTACTCKCMSLDAVSQVEPSLPISRSITNSCS